MTAVSAPTTPASTPITPTTPASAPITPTTPASAPITLDLGDTSLTIHRFDDYCNNRQNIENNRLDFWL